MIHFSICILIVTIPPPPNTSTSLNHFNLGRWSSSGSVYFLRHFYKATGNANSSWLAFPHCFSTLSHANWSLLLYVVNSNCHSASPFANCLLWVPSSKSLSHSLTHFRSRRRSRAQPFVCFRAKTDKGIDCLADHPHSVTLYPSWIFLLLVSGLILSYCYILTFDPAQKYYYKVIHRKQVTHSNGQ